MTSWIGVWGRQPGPGEGFRAWWGWKPGFGGFLASVSIHSFGTKQSHANREHFLRALMNAPGAKHPPWVFSFISPICL